MILYLDASALVKNYVAEPGTEEVRAAIAASSAVGTQLISRVEVAAALAKAVRVGALTQDEAFACLARFQKDWPDLIRLCVSEALVSRAAQLAWDHGLRGYDAVHLAAADVWRDTLGEEVTVAAYDRKLWHAVRDIGMQTLPLRPPAGKRP
jgi:predicted nucleic acid-binding protein